MSPGPIDIQSSKSSAYPSHQQKQSAPLTSNLTSALKAAGEAGHMTMANASQPSISVTNTSNDKGPTSSNINIQNPIGHNNGNGKTIRRESMAASEGMRSLMNGGMSWGGVSVGSWIRDDIIMTGTSPFSYQSPSYHSSSYLPKLEANFFRDFSCCGETLPSLHDLLQHYEEVHAQQLQNGQINLPQTLTRDGRTPSFSTGPAVTGGLNMLRTQQLHQQRLAQLAAQNQAAGRGERLGSLGGGHGGSGIDVAEEMEMDDGDLTPPANTIPMMSGMRSGINQQQQQAHQTQIQTALRMATQMPNSTMHLNNPTVSSVNTPNLPNPTTPGMDRYMSPESSVPGTPRALDNGVEFDPLNFQNLSLTNNSFLPMDGDIPLDLCITDPAKNLYNHMGTGAPRGGAYSHMSIAQLRAVREQTELARMMGGDSLLHSTMGTGVNIPGDGNIPHGWMLQEDKPFKCPVIGCEKAYKNQNGLKYHKNHGHTNQTLHQNPDGTLSIVNPDTSIPYPGTMGMEKEKPYKCEFCGKRYKNLNGLKYHRGHSTHGGLHPIPLGFAVTDQIGEE